MPPTPDPSTWAIRAYDTGITSISMTATTASDPRAGVQYYFHCLTSGGHDSGWQASATYQDTGLSANTTYTYEVMTRDQSLNMIKAYSPSASATTLPQAVNTTSSTVGLYYRTMGRFHLRNSNDAGVADVTFRFGPANSTWPPLTGDWDGNGTVTVGLYDPATSRFYLRNSNSTGVADVTFAFGPANSGWKPIAGDWEWRRWHRHRSACTTRRQPVSSSETATAAASPTTLSITAWPTAVGRRSSAYWDGDGTDSGFWEPAVSRFYSRNENSSGVADLTFRCGPMGSGWKPIVGDWNGDGTETIGLEDPAASRFYLRNESSTGVADLTLNYGPAYGGWTPLAWNSSCCARTAARRRRRHRCRSGHRAAHPVGVAAVGDRGDCPLGGGGLVGAFGRGPLKSVQFTIADLPGSELGLAREGAITIDNADAAGHGWFVDPTPATDEEFASSGDCPLQPANSRPLTREPSTGSTC